MKNENNIEISKAIIEDAEGIINVLYKTWLDTYPNKDIGITDEDINERFNDLPVRIEKMKERILNTPAKHVRLVAKEKGVVVGMTLLINDELYNQLQMIYVLPEYQGRGIGQMLWDELKNHLDQTKDIIVQVADYNHKAINFYTKLGFTDTGKRWSDEKWKMKSGATIPEMEMIMKSKI